MHGTAIKNKKKHLKPLSVRFPSLFLHTNSVALSCELMCNKFLYLFDFLAATSGTPCAPHILPTPYFFLNVTFVALLPQHCNFVITLPAL